MSPTPDPARTVATTGATPSSSVVGDLGLHGPCRHIGSGTALATLAALTLALNPIYFGLSCTFMTDVPFTVLLILSILGSSWGSIRGETGFFGSVWQLPLRPCSFANLPWRYSWPSLSLLRSGSASVAAGSSTRCPPRCLRASAWRPIPAY